MDRAVERSDDDRAISQVATSLAAGSERSLVRRGQIYWLLVLGLDSLLLPPVSRPQGVHFLSELRKMPD